MNSLNKKAAPQRELINVNEVITEIIALLRNEAARHRHLYPQPSLAPTSRKSQAIASNCSRFS